MPYQETSGVAKRLNRRMSRKQYTLSSHRLVCRGRFAAEEHGKLIRKVGAEAETETETEPEMMEEAEEEVVATMVEEAVEAQRCWWGQPEGVEEEEQEEPVREQEVVVLELAEGEPGIVEEVVRKRQPGR